MVLKLRSQVIHVFLGHILCRGMYLEKSVTMIVLSLLLLVVATVKHLGCFQIKMHVVSLEWKIRELHYSMLVFHFDTSKTKV